MTRTVPMQTTYLPDLKARLEEATETLEAIRRGCVDAIVVTGPEGDQVFTLEGADEMYRILVEAMNEGAVSLDAAGTILYANRRFAQMVRTPLEDVLGVAFTRFVPRQQHREFVKFLAAGRKRRATVELELLVGDSRRLTAYLSGNPVFSEDLATVCVVVNDITQRKRLEASRRDLSRNVMRAQELERQRVARELHDGINQLLSTTKYRLQALEQSMASRDPGAAGQLAKARNLLERSIHEVRLISRNLRPSELDDLGLKPALEALLEEVSDQTGLALSFKAPQKLPALTPEAELAIYRIVQEVLQNVEKHARARQALLELSVRAGYLTLEITDDGCGFNPSRVRRRRFGLGLANVRERASMLGGKAVIKSAPGKGTTITVTLPI